MKPTTLAVIVGNRDFFPDELVTEARQDVEAVFAEMGIRSVMIDAAATKLGGVETWEDAKKCGALFAEHRAEIDGVLVVLPNFGDEQGVADTIKLSGLDVPTLVQAYPDNVTQFNIERRRDAFCGKISVCNNLRQYGYPYTLTERHTCQVNSDEFKADLAQFVGICRVVGGLKNARIGAIGARPGAFKTVRYSEKLLQANGISVMTVDLSEMFGAASKMGDNDARVVAKLEAIRDYIPTPGVPGEALVKMAKLGLAIDDWMAAGDIDASALQCWNSIQANYGVNACSLMSMMSDKLMPSACEVDVCGALSMYALQLATGRPSALIDWNNNYGDDPDKCVLFHCSNWAKSFFESDAARPGCCTMEYANVLATTLGRENTYGSVAGRVPAGPMSFARISTDDVDGVIRAYVGNGQFTDDPLDTFGGRAVVEVPGLQDLLKVICKYGFEHHGAMNAAPSADILAEAFDTYMDWDVYQHS